MGMGIGPNPPFQKNPKNKINKFYYYFKIIMKFIYLYI